MAIQYAVVPNALQPGQFYPRPMAAQTRDLRRIIRGIEKKTTVSASDISAVVRALVEEVVEGLLDGVRVSIDGLADFSVRLSQVLRSPVDEFSLDGGGEVLVSAVIKPQLTEQIRSEIQLEKIGSRVKLPELAAFRNAATKSEGVYTPGSIGHIIGENLQIGDDSDPLQGIFFIDSDGTEHKVSVVQTNGDRHLVFNIPVELMGEVTVEVRTRYTPAGQLRTGQLAGFLMPV